MTLWGGSQALASIDVNRFSGTSAADNIIGASGRDLILGVSGNDTMDAGALADVRTGIKTLVGWRGQSAA